MNYESVNIKTLKTYSTVSNKTQIGSHENNHEDDFTVPLSTLNAVKYLLQGTLRLRVCRYCLNVTSKLSEFDEVLTLAISGALHEVTIRDIVASFHPYKIADNPNFPNKICTECVNRAISCYLFTQQCERAERALRNCFEDIYEKLEKLDPLEPVKRRGKRKVHPNYNLIYTEHDDVISFAQPVINIVNITNDSTLEKSNVKISELECQKCWQILPSIESLLNHETLHPKSMWFNCRLCGKSFVKRTQLKKHIKETHMFIEQDPQNLKIDDFKCNECASTNKSLGEHLVHNEKHKFKSLFKGLVEKKVDSFCTVCLDKSSHLTSLTDIVHLHGGYPGSTGAKTINKILTATLPDIKFDTYTGTKICNKCYNHAISSYIFIMKIQHAHNRLNSCITSMLNTLCSIGETSKNLMVEISQDTILQKFELDDEETESIPEDNYDDEIKIDILEDEFRLPESESEESQESEESDISTDFMPLYNPAKNITKTYTKKKVFNGYKNDCEDTIFRDDCSEFLSFKKKFERPKYVAKYRYTCPFCNKHFISDYFLKKHILKHIQKKSHCNICLSNFKSKFYLFEHKKVSHILKLEEYIACKICGRTFISMKKMKSHQKSHRIKECQLCDKLFASQKYYDIHMQRHAVKFTAYKNIHMQTCSFCEKACSNENELSLHVNKMHLQIKPYSCDMCEKQFYTENNLLSHKKLHSLYSKESCEICDKNFKCRKSLVIHIRKHLDIKPHACPVCKQSFYSDLILKKHMKIFHGGIYSCRLCKAVLPSQLVLKSHINLMHSTM